MNVSAAFASTTLAPISVPAHLSGSRGPSGTRCALRRWIQHLSRQVGLAAHNRECDAPSH